LQILTEFGMQTARYAINPVTIHHFHVMIDIYVLEQKLIFLFYIAPSNCNKDVDQKS